MFGGAGQVVEADPWPVEAFAPLEEESMRCGGGAQDVAVVEF